MFSRLEYITWWSSGNTLTLPLMLTIQGAHAENLIANVCSYKHMAKTYSLCVSPPSFYQAILILYQGEDVVPDHSLLFISPQGL